MSQTSSINLPAESEDLKDFPAPAAPAEGSSSPSASIQQEFNRLNLYRNATAPSSSFFSIQTDLLPQRSLEHLHLSLALEPGQQALCESNDFDPAVPPYFTSLREDLPPRSWKTFYDLIPQCLRQKYGIQYSDFLAQDNVLQGKAEVQAERNSHVLVEAEPAQLDKEQISLRDSRHVNYGL